MTEVIASLALITSIMLLIIQYRNQIERRHGEIVQLRSDFLKRIATIRQRLTSVQMYSETMRLELRRLRDCEDKYKSIEEMPALIEKIKNSVQQVDRIKEKVDSMDTKKFNKSKVLFVFQSFEVDLQKLEDLTNSVEQDTLKFLEHLHTQQEKEEKQG
jgi:signal transduction histidine kinase